MNESDGDARAGPAPDEGVFVRTIEEHFRRLRGRPLLLSPEDFERALSWRRDGIPLHLVLRTLDEVFRKAAEGRPRRRPMTLAYCEPAVREAFEMYKELQLGAAPAADSGPSRSELIDLACGVLERSKAPAGLVAATIAALRASCGRSPGDPAADPVPRIADRLVDESLASLDAGSRAEIVNEARGAVAPYAAEMSPEIRERAFRIALARGVRRRFGLPDLTLIPPF